MTIADLVCLLLVVPLLIATTVFVVEAGLGAKPQATRPSPDTGFDPRSAVVLVPAHDEERGIAAVLRAMQAGVPAGMEILVVADNCTDDTAVVARSTGVRVIERHDPVNRGKGFALDHGRAALAADPPACVIVVDADTVPAPGALASVATRAIAAGRPVQAAYTIALDAADASTARFSAAAFYVKNAVRQLGAARLGAPALLTGSGMAFPWDIFSTLPLATGHVAEDLMLGVRAALHGRSPLFDPGAVVLGSASNDRGTAVQRRRWESGFFQVAGDHAGTLIGRGIMRGRPAMIWLGLHLLTPPLVPLLALDGLAVLVLAGVALVTGSGIVALGLLGTLTVVAMVLVIVALLAHGQGGMLQGWRDVPRYVLWKLGLSLAAMVRRERRWIRTDRE